ncbi:MAG: hypothetical protein ACFCA4_01910 [Cyanophyceae cyanobacterium]
MKEVKSSKPYSILEILRKYRIQSSGAKFFIIGWWNKKYYLASVCRRLAKSTRSAFQDFRDSKYYKWIFLAIFSLVVALVTLDFFIPDEYPFNDYIQGLATESIGILITLSIVDIFYRRSDKSENKRLEKLKIMRLDIILSRHMITCQLLGVECLSRMKDRGGEHAEYPEKFDFRNLRDVFTPSLICFDGIPVGLHTIAAHIKLRDIIEEILLREDFHYYPEVGNLLSEYLYRLRNSSRVEGMIKMHCINKELQRQVREKISNYPSPDLSTGVSDIILLPYADLFHFIHFQKDFSEDYESVMGKVRV